MTLSATFIRTGPRPGRSCWGAVMMVVIDYSPKEKMEPCTVKEWLARVFEARRSRPYIPPTSPNRLY